MRIRNDPKSIHDDRPERCCRTGDYGVIAEYLDGTLNGDQSARFEEHMRTCEECRHLAAVSSLAKRITSRAADAEAESFKAIAPERIERSKEALKQALRSEYGLVRDTAATADAAESSSRREGLVAFLSSRKFSAYAGAAAAVVIMTTALLFTSSGLIGRFKASMDSMNGTPAALSSDDGSLKDLSDAEMAQDSTSRAKDTTQPEENAGTVSSVPIQDGSSAGSNEKYGSDAQGEPSFSASVPWSSADAVTSGGSADAGSAADDGRTYFSGSDYAWLEGDNESVYLFLKSEAICSQEYADPAHSYVGIFAYPEGSIASYKEKFLDLMAKAGIAADIEIISGENTQKLVEYTGESDGAFSMAAAMEPYGASFLILSIGR